MRVRYYVEETQARNEFAAISTAALMGLTAYKEIQHPDPVLGGRFQYNQGGWDYVGPCPIRPISADERNLDAPACAHHCKYRQSFHGFDLQRNALRIELPSLVATDRCGWNVKPGRLGGHPLDYAPCTYKYDAAIASAKREGQ